ncbi:MAG: NTP transferase domain-containing protein [Paludibacteraceae bacterium]|nr:NTP transferase domain-containing protein [Paludibacteraceae bacterium]
MKALIFAAGLGTRLRPLTDTMPKALVPVHGQTLLEYQIRKLQSAGINDIIVNVHHFPDMIIDYLRENNNFGSNITISDERDNLLDTGGGLLKAWSTFAPDESLLAINVDILSDINLRDIINEYTSLADNPSPLALLVVKSRETQRYLCFDEENKLVGWTNVATSQLRGQDGKHLAFSGMQVLSPQVLPLLQAFAQEHGPKFSVIEFYLYVVEHQLGVLRALPIDVPLIDVGKLDQLSQLS